MIYEDFNKLFMFKCKLKAHINIFQFVWKQTKADIKIVNMY